MGLWWSSETSAILENGMGMKDKKTRVREGEDEWWRRGIIRYKKRLQVRKWKVQISDLIPQQKVGGFEEIVCVGDE